MVRPEGLEPPRFYPADPKSAASANSAMAARVLFCHSFHARYAFSIDSGDGWTTRCVITMLL